MSNLQLHEHIIFSFFYSSFGRYLGCFHFLDFVNRVALNKQAG